MSFQKFYCLIIATLLLFGLNIQNVLATDCEILSNALTSFSTAIQSEMKKTTDCCQFTGVTCNSQKQITSLNFSKVTNYSMDINAFFTELAKLEQLTTLELKSIKGKISSGLPSIDKLKSIKNFILTDSSSIIGLKSIPEEFGNLTNLEKLDLSDNLINGKLPKSLSKLTKLKYLNLNNNFIEGYIPYEYKNLNNLVQLQLKGNISLKGYVPLFSNISTCDYESTQLCNLNSAKCKSGRYNCIKKDIEETNQENGNPNPKSTELDNEASTSRLASSSYSGNGTSSGSTRIKTRGLRSLLYIFLMIIICCAICAKCCCCSSHSKPNKPIQTTTAITTTNNATTNVPYPAADGNVSSVAVTPSPYLNAPYPSADGNVSSVAVTPSPYLNAPYPAADGNTSVVTPVSTPTPTPAPVSGAPPVVAPAYNYNPAPMPMYPVAGTYPPPADPNVSAVYNPPIPPSTDPNASAVYNAPSYYQPPPMVYPPNAGYPVPNPYGIPPQDPNASYIPPQGPITSAAPNAPTAPTAPTDGAIPTTSPQTANAPYGMAPQAPNAPYGV